MKRLLLLLGISVAGCGAPDGVDDSAGGQEQAVVSGAPSPESALGRTPAGSGVAPASAQAVDLRARVLSNDEKQGPTDPVPWRRPVEDSAKADTAK